MKNLSEKQLVICFAVCTVLGLALVFFDYNDITFYLGFMSCAAAVGFLIVLLIKSQTEDGDKKHDTISKEKFNIQTVKEKESTAFSHKTTVKPTCQNKNLTTCKICGAEIAKTAKHCPHCGATPQSETLKQIGLGLSVFIIIVILIICVAVFKSSLKNTNNTASNAFSTNNTSTSTSNTSETMFYEDDYITASFIQVYEQDLVEGMFALQLRVTNKSQQKIIVSLNNASVNNVSTTIGSGLPMEIQPGNSSKQPFIVFANNLDIQNISEIKNISFSFYLFDENMKKLEETNIVTLNF